MKIFFELTLCAIVSRNPFVKISLIKFTIYIHCENFILIGSGVSA